MKEEMTAGEFGFIERIKAAFSPLLPVGTEGIGDDCAVIPVGGGDSIVVTTDMLVEGVHFLPGSISARELGAKSLAVNLSDVAAMGAAPFASFLSLSLPAEMTGEWAAEFMEGYRSLSERYSVPLLGGDTTLSRGGVTINVVAMGKAADGNIKRRSGAGVSDRIFVTSTLGDSAAGLEVVLDKGALNTVEDRIVRVHNNPRPHTKEGLWLGRESGVTAMMDISDGIASDLAHILRASGVGATIDTGLLPFSADFSTVCADRGWDRVKLAVSGGEDFSLLVVIKDDNSDDINKRFLAEFGYNMHRIGVITRGEPLINWVSEGRPTGVVYSGFSHF